MGIGSETPNAPTDEGGKNAGVCEDATAYVPSAGRPSDMERLHPWASQRMEGEEEDKTVHG